jgi:hypothetical protein
VVVQSLQSIFLCGTKKLVSDVSAAKIDARLLDITFLIIPVSYKAATFLFFFFAYRESPATAPLRLTESSPPSLLK